MNKLIITGNAGADAQVGTGWVKINVAVNDGFMKDGQWQDRTNWFTCFAKGDASDEKAYLAKKVSSVKKGERVMIDGSIAVKDKQFGDEKVNTFTVNIYKLENFGKFQAEAKAEAAAPVSEEEDLPF